MLTPVADIGVNLDCVNEANDNSTKNMFLEYVAASRTIVQFELAERRHAPQGASLSAAANDVVDLVGEIADLLDDPPLRKEMGQMGRERLEQILCNRQRFHHRSQPIKESCGQRRHASGPRMALPVSTAPNLFSAEQRVTGHTRLMQ